MVLCRAFLSLNNKLQDIVVWTIKNNFNSHLYIELLIQLLLKINLKNPKKFGVIKEKHHQSVSTSILAFKDPN